MLYFSQDVSLDMPDTLDLGFLRGSGRQAGEEKLPESSTTTSTKRKNFNSHV
jgi:hypothetical protein